MLIGEIYNQLLAGKKVEMEFETPQEFHKFRVSLFRFKAAQDKILEDIGEQIFRQALSIKFAAETGVASLSFKNKVESKAYKVRIIETGEIKNECGEIKTTT